MAGRHASVRACQGASVVDGCVGVGQEHMHTFTSSMPRGGGTTPKFSMTGKSILLGYTSSICIMRCTKVVQTVLQRGNTCHADRVHGCIN